MEFKEKFRAPQSFIDQWDTVVIESSKTTSPQRSQMGTMAGQNSQRNVIKPKASGPSSRATSAKRSTHGSQSPRKLDTLKITKGADSIDEERLSNASARSYERLLDEE